MQRREFMRMCLAAAAGTAAAPAATRAQATLDCKATNDVRMPRRIVADRSCGIIIDVQESFLAQLDGSGRRRIVSRTRRFARLLNRFQIPTVVTLERPVEENGSLPQEIKERLASSAATFEKDFYDLTKDKPIKKHLAQLNKKQVIIAGAESDVCVLESCLGLLSLGYEVFLVENLLFSSSRNVDAALGRMNAEGATFLSYKSLFYALTERVETGQTVKKSIPDKLPQ